MLLWYMLNANTMVRVTLGHLPSAFTTSWIGVMMPLMSCWVYVANELVLVLASKLSRPPWFAATNSTQGLRVIVAVAAVCVPAQMVIKLFLWSSFCANRRLGV